MIRIARVCTASSCSTCVLIMQSMVLYSTEQHSTRMWANDQRDGRPAEYRWRPLFNAAKFG